MTRAISLERLGVAVRRSGEFAECKVEAPCKILCDVSWGCSVGAFTYIQEGSAIEGADIGRFCSIARGVSIGAGEHPTDWLSTHPFVNDPEDVVTGLSSLLPEMRGWFRGQAKRPFFQRGQTTIGNDVWIGEGAYVARGVRIADGAIIGARAVVTRDVPPYGVAVGSPARVTRTRVDPEHVERLLMLRWWDYDLRPIIPLLDFSSVSQSIDVISEAIAVGRIRRARYQRFIVADGANDVAACA